MRRSAYVPLLLALPVMFFLSAAGPARAGAPTGLTVIIENRAPINGTWLTPTWVGYHDGTFDTHTLGAAASIELERLAEDGDTGPMPQLAPGETMSMKFTLDGSGNFLGAYFTIYGTEVKDAGTEVNDELPQNTAFFGQTVPNTGVDENGVVHMHPGYLPPGSGGILDDPMFAGADFIAPGYEIARILIVRSDTVVPGGDVSGTWTAAGSPYIVEGNITVPAGQILTIEPGVTVFFTSWYAFTVNGFLEALGAADAPILFTATPPGPGEPGWKGVRFVNADGGHLAHCIMENGQTQAAAPFDRGAGIYCVVEDNLAGYNSSARGGGIVAVDCGGIYFSYTSATVANTIVADNEGSGIHFGTSSNVDVSFSDFHSNSLGDFTGGSIPSGLGSIVTVNANNDPCDAYYNIFLDPEAADSSWNLGTMPQNGILVFSVTVPAHWAPGEFHHLQALVGPWGGSLTRLTNLLVLSLE